MSEANLLMIWLTQCAAQSPALLVTLAACVIVLAKREQASSSSGWALLGFALAFALGLLIPLAQLLLQRWMIEGHEPLAAAGRAAAALALATSALHALSYASLLAAIFVGRRPLSLSPPPPSENAATPSQTP